MFQYHKFLEEQHKIVEEAQQAGDDRRAEVHQAIINGTQAAVLPEVTEIREWVKDGCKDDQTL